MYELVIFDLDGTLVDTLPDLAAAVNYALLENGFPSIPLERVSRGIGDGAEQLIYRCLPEDFIRSQKSGLSPLATQTINLFLEHYTENCTRLSRPFPGVEQSLHMLSEISLAVLTNKPLAATMRILNELGLASYFSEVLGGDGPWGKKPDPGGLQHLRRKAHSTPETTLLVGDGWQDLQVARNDGVRFLCFQGGYGSSAPELAGYTPAFATFSELPGLIRSLSPTVKPTEDTAPGEKG